jgi:putative ABC transport system permease protein
MPPKMDAHTFGMLMWPRPMRSDSYFLSFSALDALIAARQKISVAAGVPISAKPVAPAQSGDPLAILATHHHAVASGPINCLPDLAPGEVSAFLLQLSPGASAGSVKFAVGQVPGLKIVAGNAVFTASRQALGSLFWGIAVFAGLLLLALLFLVTLLFSAIVQERYREIGLLRAMGARPAQIMSIILIEAGLITSLGGLLGLGVGLSLVLAFARSLGFYFASLGVPFTWPPDWAIPDDPDRERAMILRTSGLIKRYGAGAGYEAVSEAELTLRGNSSRSSVGQAPASRRFWR